MRLTVWWIDVYKRQAVRLAVRLAIWSGLRPDWPAALLPADGDAACLPNPASHDAGTMRIWRVDRAILPKAEEKPLSFPDWRDAGRARGIRPVSYTHLDVYKRQFQSRLGKGSRLHYKAAAWEISKRK